jgi:hypothetical protein
MCLKNQREVRETAADTEVINKLDSKGQGPQRQSGSHRHHGSRVSPHLATAYRSDSKMIGKLQPSMCIRRIQDNTRIEIPKEEAARSVRA